jgi:hypothetical protein
MALCFKPSKELFIPGSILYWEFALEGFGFEFSKIHLFFTISNSRKVFDIFIWERLC